MNGQQANTLGGIVMAFMLADGVKAEFLIGLDFSGKAGEASYLSGAVSGAETLGLLTF